MTSIRSNISIETGLLTHFSKYSICNYTFIKTNVACFKRRVSLCFTLVKIDKDCLEQVFFFLFQTYKILSLNIRTLSGLGQRKFIS